MPVVTLDPRRGIALAFKPAEERDQLLRIWETAGRSGPTEIRLPGYREAISTDLLKRDLSPLAIRDGHITLYLRTNGFAAVRLIQ